MVYLEAAGTVEEGRVKEDAALVERHSASCWDSLDLSAARRSEGRIKEHGALWDILLV